MSKGLDEFDNYILSRLKPSDIAFLDVRNAIQQVKKELKELDFIKKCFYVAKSSGAVLLTDYGFEHKEELKEVLL